MSTRCITWFCRNGDPQAKVYRHSDGYPEGAGTDIYRFFDELKREVRDQRFGDPSYLAAKYVVWLADLFNAYERQEFKKVDGEYKYVPKPGVSKLEFLSVGVMIKDPGDIEYRYRIHCDQFDEDGLPVVECFKVKHDMSDGEKCEIPRPQPGDQAEE